MSSYAANRPIWAGIAILMTGALYPASAIGAPIDVCSLLSVKTASAVVHAKVQPHPIPEGPACFWTTGWPPTSNATGAGINVNVNVVSARTLAHVDQAIAAFHGQRIPDLGDKAAWYPKHGSNAGHLAVYKGNRLITIGIGRSGEIADDLEGSKVAAREILSRLH